MVYPDAWKCPNCKAIVKHNKQCSNCGFKYSMHYPDLWQCPECKNLVSDSRTCDKCSYPENLHYPHLWHCPQCGNLVHSSAVCDECGYDTKNAPKQAEDKISGKISSLGGVIKQRKKILGIAFGIIVLVGLLLVLSVRPEPLNSFVAPASVDSGEAFSPFFSTTSSTQSVSFDFVSPNGKVYTYPGVEKDGKWFIDNLILNESGLWSVTVTALNFGAVTEVSGSIYANATCSQDSNCSSKICCFGTCVLPACSVNSDCNDNISVTRDLCVYGGACQSRCNFIEPLCSPVSDGYCPSGCDRVSDSDCTSCPSGKLLCGSTCYSACYSNNDCNDDDETTFDECVENANPCESYCTYTPYSEVSCPSGLVRNGTACIEPLCSGDNDCTAMGSGYAHRCWYPGTANAYCAYQQCSAGQAVCVVNGSSACFTPACDSNSDCNTGAPNTFFYCMNHGSCSAYCLSTCNTGFTSFGGQCVKSCSSIVDCASYYGGLNSAYSLACSGAPNPESCTADAYRAAGFTYYCDYSNHACRHMECASSANCDDGSPCTTDYCDSTYVCHHDLVASGTLVNSGSSICCSGVPRSNCGSNAACNAASASLTWNSAETIGYTGITSADTSVGAGYLTVTVDAAGKGVFISVACTNSQEFFITARAKSNSDFTFGLLSAADAVGYSSVHIKGGEWQTYAVNGTMDCSKPEKIAAFYSNEAGVLYLDSIDVYLGQSNPKTCLSPDSCSSGCSAVNGCVNSDSLCPAGCTYSTDNDCKICAQPSVYSGAGCCTPACYSSSDCASGEVCFDKGACGAYCSTV